MSIRIRDIDPKGQFCKTVTADVINEIVPKEIMEAIVEECGVKEKRIRKMPAWLTMLLCIGMNLYSEESLKAVMVSLSQGSRLLRLVEVDELARKGSISKARYRLGEEPMKRLFQRVCQPLATPATIGAFVYGLRIVAIDGSTEEVADTAENAAYFGRARNGHSESAFPLVQCVYLAECGTHAIIDADFAPYGTSERIGAEIVLRSVVLGMLLMLDRGLYSYKMLAQAYEKGAQVLVRVRSSDKPKPMKRLPDGTYLAYIGTPGQENDRLLVRVIEYTINDPNRPGHGEVHRLLTTLLDPELYPVLDLICLYHERWEIELVIDEMDTHQRLPNRPLRSRKPAGVIQELYGLLIAHYIIRSIMHDAAVEHHLDPDRLSFINSVRLICHAVAEFQIVHPNMHPLLRTRLLRDIAHFQLPPRDNRINPRVIKRQQSKFERKKPKHFHPPRPIPFRQSVVLPGEAAHA